MVDYRTDQQLVEACLAGDAQAWEQLVTRYQRLVYSVAIHQGLAAQDAEDVFQTVFALLLNKLSTCRHRDRLGAWLTTITRREAWRVARQRSKLAEEGEQNIQSFRAAEPLPDALLEQLEEQDLIRQALDRLGERCHRLLRRLFYVREPPSYAEIAEELAIPQGSIGPTRARCLERLRRILASWGFR